MSQQPSDRNIQRSAEEMMEQMFGLNQQTLTSVHNIPIPKSFVCILQVKNMTVVIHLFEIITLLIFPFHKGFSILNFRRSSVFLRFYFLLLYNVYAEKNKILIFMLSQSLTRN